MTDLVERLRRQAPHLDDTWAEEWPNGDLMNEGADALEAAIEEAASWRRVAEKLEGEKQDALEAARAQASTPIDLDMPAEQLRLHMGELTASEVRVARAAIALANTATQAQAAEVRRAAAEVKAACGAYLGDETMEQLLFGEMADEKTGTATFQLGRLRRVRAAIRALTDAAKGDRT